MSNPSQASSPSQKQLQALSDEYQKLQTDMQSSVSARQKLEAQQQENMGVQKEFNKLADSANIYKLLGPVLLKQDRSEAMSAVDARLEYISGEIKRIEAQLQTLQEKSEQKKTEIYALQSEMQQQQQQPAAAAQTAKATPA